VANISSPNIKNKNINVNLIWKVTTNGENAGIDFVPYP
jgi:hypothetical protein